MFTSTNFNNATRSKAEGTGHMAHGTWYLAHGTEDKAHGTWHSVQVHTHVHSCHVIRGQGVNSLCIISFRVYFQAMASSASCEGPCVDAEQVQRIDELCAQADPPPNPHLCQARVFRGAQQCSRTPISGTSFCFQHQDIQNTSQHIT